MDAIDGLATGLATRVGHQFVDKRVLHLSTPTGVCFWLFFKRSIARGTFPVGAFIFVGFSRRNRSLKTSAGPVADTVNVVDSVAGGAVPDLGLGGDIFGADQTRVFACRDFGDQLVRDILEGGVGVCVGVVFGVRIAFGGVIFI